MLNYIINHNKIATKKKLIKVLQNEYVHTLTSIGYKFMVYGSMLTNK